LLMIINWKMTLLIGKSIVRESWTNLMKNKSIIRANPLYTISVMFAMLTKQDTVSIS
jgi:hypothetical protein